MVTGSRRGEVSALRWHHVDLDGVLLTLQRSNAQPKSGLKEKQTKTRQQRRVMIDPQTVALLTAHRAVCEGRCAALGVDRDPDAYLFSPAPRSIQSATSTADVPDGYEALVLVEAVQGSGRWAWTTTVPRSPTEGTTTGQPQRGTVTI
jgi:integrase